VAVFFAAGNTTLDLCTGASQDPRVSSPNVIAVSSSTNQDRISFSPAQSMFVTIPKTLYRRSFNSLLQSFSASRPENSISPRIQYTIGNRQCFLELERDAPDQPRLSLLQTERNILSRYVSSHNR